MTDITHADSGDLIRRLRIEAGMTRWQLAELSGYAYQTITYIENNESRSRRQRGGCWRTICDLLDAMGYDVVLRRRDG